jgi:hypothetical protein
VGKEAATWTCVPDPFRGEVVVIAVCHESGKDIALDLRKMAMEVHISVKSIDDVAPGVPKPCPGTATCTCDPDVSKAGTIQAIRLLVNIIWHVLDRSNTCATTGPWCSPTAPVSSPTPSSTARDTTSRTRSWTPAGRSPRTTTEWARCSSTRSRQRWRRSSPSLACPRRCSCRGAQARWVAQVLFGRRKLPPVEEMLRSVGVQPRPGDGRRG